MNFKTNQFQLQNEPQTPDAYPPEPRPDPNPQPQPNPMPNPNPMPDPNPMPNPLPDPAPFPSPPEPIPAYPPDVIF